MDKQKKKELIAAGVFLLGAIMMYVGYMYSLGSLEEIIGGPVWNAGKRFLTYILYAVIFFILPYEKFYNLFATQRKANKDKGLLYIIFSEKRLCVISLVIFAIIAFVFWESIEKTYIFFSLNCYSISWWFKYIIIIGGIICISVWTVWQIEEQYKSFIISYIGFAVLAVAAYVFSFEEFNFSVVVILSGSLAWNITYMVYNKKISLTNIGLTVLFLLMVLCTFILFSGRVTQLENILYPEAAPYDGGWELLQIRQYWIGDGFVFDSNVLEWKFMKNHQLLTILKYGRVTGLLVFVGIACVIAACVSFVKCHQGKKRYVVIGVLSCFLVCVGCVIISGMGIVPISTIRMPFTGVNLTRDAIMLGVVLHCMIPCSWLKRGREGKKYSGL